jgi:hypothetical protein
MMIGQTEGDGCREGSLECECYGNDTCDPGLSCAEGADVCVPDGCVPGSRSCVCGDDFECDAGLACEGSVCVLPGDTTSSTNPSGTSSSSTTSTPDDDSTSGGASTEPATSVSTTPNEGSSSTGDLEECGGLSCAACSGDCVVAQGQPCHDEWLACENEGNCPTVAGCMYNCSVRGSCLDPCCDGVPENVLGPAQALHTCLGNTCAAGGGPCTDWDVQASCA